MNEPNFDFETVAANEEELIPGTITVFRGSEKVEEIDPKTIKYNKQELVDFFTDEDLGITTYHYNLSEPTTEVSEKYQLVSHRVRMMSTAGNKRISYDVFSGDTIELGKFLYSLDVSATG